MYDTRTIPACESRPKPRCSYVSEYRYLLKRTVIVSSVWIVPARSRESLPGIGPVICGLNARHLPLNSNPRLPRAPTTLTRLHTHMLLRTCQDRPHIPSTPTLWMCTCIYSSLSYSTGLLCSAQPISHTTKHGCELKHQLCSRQPQPEL